MDQKTLWPALEKMLIKLAVDRAVKAAVSKLTFLGWPVINPVFAYFVNRWTTWFAKESELGAARLWVYLAVGAEVKSVEEAKTKLKDLLDNPSKYLADQAAQIEAEFDEKAVDLIRIHDRRL